MAQVALRILLHVWTLLSPHGVIGYRMSGEMMYNSYIYILSSCFLLSYFIVCVHRMHTLCFSTLMRSRILS